MPSSIWWTICGVLIGLVIMAPVIRLLLRRAEERARIAERRARESERLAELGSMTGGLAHEIKNPLSTIGLNAQLLSEGLSDATLPEDQRDRLQRRLTALGREAERLRGILTDFLQFAGRMNLDVQPVDIVQLVQELADFFHPQCDQAQVTLRTQLPSDPLIVPADEGLLKQALLNLMINGVQAMSPGTETNDGPAGELMLRVDRTDDHVTIHVTDTGPGIPAEKQAEIFHPYVSGRRAGTGLGLATARRIVEEHGGALELHSDLGRGSDFSLTLDRRVR